MHTTIGDPLDTVPVTEKTSGKKLLDQKTANIIPSTCTLYDSISGNSFYAFLVIFSQFSLI